MTAALPTGILTRRGGRARRGDHWNYGHREPLAYQTGFAHSVYAQAGLGAPELLAAVDPRPGSAPRWGSSLRDAVATLVSGSLAHPAYRHAGQL